MAINPCVSMREAQRNGERNEVACPHGNNGGACHCPGNNNSTASSQALSFERAASYVSMPTGARVCIPKTPIVDGEDMCTDMKKQDTARGHCAVTASLSTTDIIPPPSVVSEKNSGPVSGNQHSGCPYSIVKVSAVASVVTAPGGAPRSSCGLADAGSGRHAADFKDRVFTGDYSVADAAATAVKYNAAVAASAGVSVGGRGRMVSTEPHLQSLSDFSRRLGISEFVLRDLSKVSSPPSSVFSSKETSATPESREDPVADTPTGVTAAATSAAAQVLSSSPLAHSARVRALRGSFKTLFEDFQVYEHTCLPCLCKAHHRRCSVCGSEGDRSSDGVLQTDRVTPIQTNTGRRDIGTCVQMHEEKRGLSSHSGANSKEMHNTTNASSEKKNVRDSNCSSNTEERCAAQATTQARKEAKSKGSLQPCTYGCWCATFSGDTPLRLPYLVLPYDVLLHKRQQVLRESGATQVSVGFLLRDPYGAALSPRQWQRQRRCCHMHRKSCSCNSSSIANFTVQALREISGTCSSSSNGSSKHAPDGSGECDTHSSAGSIKDFLGQRGGCGKSSSSSGDSNAAHVLQRRSEPKSNGRIATHSASEGSTIVSPAFSDASGYDGNSNSRTKTSYRIARDVENSKAVAAVERFSHRRGAVSAEEEHAVRFYEGKGTRMASCCTTRGAAGALPASTPTTEAVDNVGTGSADSWCPLSDLEIQNVEAFVRFLAAYSAIYKDGVYFDEKKQPPLEVTAQQHEKEILQQQQLGWGIDTSSSRQQVTTSLPEKRPPKMQEPSCCYRTVQKSSQLFNTPASKGAQSAAVSDSEARRVTDDMMFHAAGNSCLRDGAVGDSCRWCCCTSNTAAATTAAGAQLTWEAAAERTAEEAEEAAVAAAAGDLSTLLRNDCCDSSLGTQEASSQHLQSQNTPPSENPFFETEEEGAHADSSTHKAHEETQEGDNMTAVRKKSRRNCQGKSLRSPDMQQQHQQGIARSDIPRLGQDLNVAGRQSNTIFTDTATELSKRQSRRQKAYSGAICPTLWVLGDWAACISRRIHGADVAVGAFPSDAFVADHADAAPASITAAVAGTASSFSHSFPSCLDAANTLEGKVDTASEPLSPGVDATTAVPADGSRFSSPAFSSTFPPSVSLPATAATPMLRLEETTADAAAAGSAAAAGATDGDADGKRWPQGVIVYERNGVVASDSAVAAARTGDDVAAEWLNKPCPNLLELQKEARTNVHRFVRCRLPFLNADTLSLSSFLGEEQEQQCDSVQQRNHRKHHNRMKRQQQHHQQQQQQQQPKQQHQQDQEHYQHQQQQQQQPQQPQQHQAADHQQQQSEQELKCGAKQGELKMKDYGRSIRQEAAKPVSRVEDNREHRDNQCELEAEKVQGCESGRAEVALDKEAQNGHKRERACYWGLVRTHTPPGALQCPTARRPGPGAEDVSASLLPPEAEVEVAAQKNTYQTRRVCGDEGNKEHSEKKLETNSITTTAIPTRTTSFTTTDEDGNLARSKTALGVAAFSAAAAVIGEETNKEEKVKKQIKDTQQHFSKYFISIAACVAQQCKALRHVLAKLKQQQHRFRTKIDTTADCKPQTECSHERVFGSNQQQTRLNRYQEWITLVTEALTALTNTNKQRELLLVRLTPTAACMRYLFPRGNDSHGQILPPLDEKGNLAASGVPAATDTYAQDIDSVFLNIKRYMRTETSMTSFSRDLSLLPRQDSSHPSASYLHFVLLKVNRETAAAVRLLETNLRRLHYWGSKDSSYYARPAEEGGSSACGWASVNANSLIAFAGMKDRRGVTVQRCSARKVSCEALLEACYLSQLSSGYLFPQRARQGERHEQQRQHLQQCRRRQPQRSQEERHFPQITSEAHNETDNALHLTAAEQLPSVFVAPLGYYQEPQWLGGLLGNFFQVVIRNVRPAPAEHMRQCGDGPWADAPAEGEKVLVSAPNEAEARISPTVEGYTVSAGRSAAAVASTASGTLPLMKGTQISSGMMLSSDRKRTLTRDPGEENEKRHADVENIAADKSDAMVRIEPTSASLSLSLPLPTNPSSSSAHGADDDLPDSVGLSRVRPEKQSSFSPIGRKCSKAEPSDLFIPLSECGEEVQQLGQAVGRGMSSFRSLGFLNYYGLQRFGTHAVRTYEVGAALLRGDWTAAVAGILGGGVNARVSLEAATSVDISSSPLQASLASTRVAPTPVPAAAVASAPTVPAEHAEDPQRAKTPLCGVPEKPVSRPFSANEHSVPRGNIATAATAAPARDSPSQRDGVAAPCSPWDLLQHEGPESALKSLARHQHIERLVLLGLLRRCSKHHDVMLESAAVKEVSAAKSATSECHATHDCAGPQGERLTGASGDSTESSAVSTIPAVAAEIEGNGAAAIPASAHHVAGFQRERFQPVESFRLSPEESFQALRDISPAALQLYVHAAQSILFNFACSWRWRVYGPRVRVGDFVCRLSNTQRDDCLELSSIAGGLSDNLQSQGPSAEATLASTGGPPEANAGVQTGRRDRGYSSQSDCVACEPPSAAVASDVENLNSLESSFHSKPLHDAPAGATFDCKNRSINKELSDWNDVRHKEFSDERLQEEESKQLEHNGQPVRVIKTEEEALSASIHEVVLPLAGTDVEYPADLLNVYRQLSREILGVEFEAFHKFNAATRGCITRDYKRFRTQRKKRLQPAYLLRENTSAGENPPASKCGRVGKSSSVRDSNQSASSSRRGSPSGTPNDCTRDRVSSSGAMEVDNDGRDEEQQIEQSRVDHASVEPWSGRRAGVDSLKSPVVTVKATLCAGDAEKAYVRNLGILCKGGFRSLLVRPRCCSWQLLRAGTDPHAEPKPIMLCDVDLLLRQRRLAAAAQQKKDVDEIVSKGETVQTHHLLMGHERPQIRYVMPEPLQQRQTSEDGQCDYRVSWDDELLPDLVRCIPGDVHGADRSGSTGLKVPQAEKAAAVTPQSVASKDKAAVPPRGKQLDPLPIEAQAIGVEWPQGNASLKHADRGERPCQTEQSESAQKVRLVVEGERSNFCLLLRFWLPAGCYFTMALREIMKANAPDEDGAAFAGARLVSTTAGENAVHTYYIRGGGVAQHHHSK